MATFNGRTIFPLPSFPACPRTFEWETHDTVGITTNPFTGQQQFQDWQASWLEGAVTYQPMTNAQAIAWCAWQMSLRGSLGLFQLGDPLNRGTQNPAATSPIVSGAGQTGYSLVTIGGGGQTVGDWLQIGFRLYRITSISGGTFGIWPQIRESPTNGQVITIDNTQGIWEMKGNTRKWSVRETKIYGVSFEFREAL